MDRPFEVVYFQSALDEFRELYHRAKVAGVEQQVLEAGKEIDKQLRLDPIGFGDPVYPLRGLNLQVFGRAISPVFVHYAIHESECVVFVSGFRAAPGLDI
ncbi:MAG: hypothetical protein L0215_15110 [Gemmataceae bacterium]|nr:hypothetical protein [Gemmataceae bacterium]